MKRFLRNSALIVGLIFASVCSYSMNVSQLFMIGKGSMAGSAGLMDLNFGSPGTPATIVASNIGFYTDSACTTKTSPATGLVLNGKFPIADKQTLSLNPVSLYNLIASKHIPLNSIKCVRINFVAPPYVGRAPTGNDCTSFTETCGGSPGQCITSEAAKPVSVIVNPLGCRP